MAFTTTWASVTKYDLTSATVNPQAYAQATPRMGGFTLQNRVDFDTVTAPTLTKAVANVLKVIKIPPRTIVNKVSFCVPPGATTVAHKYTDASGSALAASSAGKSAVLNVGYINFKTLAAYQASSATSQVYDVDDLADLTVTKKTGVIAASSALPAWSASSQSTAIVSMSDTSAPVYPHIFPYGGWLALQVGGGASVSSIYGQLTGDLHVVMNCDYMPE